MSDVTTILTQFESGDFRSSDQLLELVYDELRALAKVRMSSERFDHTLQSTALVHEAYIRLVGDDREKQWNSRGHFFSAAAEAMRRILIESNRKRSSLKRGGGQQHFDIDSRIEETMATDPVRLIEISDALDHLEKTDSVAAELVKLRVFTGLSIENAGKALGIPRGSAYRNWDYARSWFASWFDEEAV